MTGHFVSSGTRHILGSPESKLHAGRITALCGVSVRADDEESPAEAVQDCGWCLQAEARARQIAQAALEAAGEQARDLWPPPDPEALQ
jgi:hypothetical protein